MKTTEGATRVALVSGGVGSAGTMGLALWQWAVPAHDILKRGVYEHFVNDPTLQEVGSWGTVVSETAIIGFALFYLLASGSYRLLEPKE